MKGTFRCGYCGKEYKQPALFDKHYRTCKYYNNKELIFNSPFKDNVNIITLNNKLNKVLTLLLDQNKRISRLENNTHKTTRIENKLLWLNKNINGNITFQEFKNNIHVTLKDYTNLTQNGYIKGNLDIILRNINLHEKFIYCFNNDGKNMYIYENQTWRSLTYPEFRSILNIIQRKLIIMSLDLSEDISYKSDLKQKELLENNRIIYGNNKKEDYDLNIYNKLYKELKIKITDIL